MQETILNAIITYAPVGIFILMLIWIPILTANLRQTKKINRKLTDTLKKADAYFKCIMEDDEREEKRLQETGQKAFRKSTDKSAEKAKDAALLQDVLYEYFS